MQMKCLKVQLTAFSTILIKIFASTRRVIKKYTTFLIYIEYCSGCKLKIILNFINLIFNLPVNMTATELKYFFLFGITLHTLVFHDKNKMKAIFSE